MSELLNKILLEQGKQAEFEAVCPGCNKHFTYPLENMSEKFHVIYKYQGHIVTACGDCKELLEDMTPFERMLDIKNPPSSSQEGAKKNSSTN
jgi:phage FluMu protein Com